MKYNLNMLKKIKRYFRDRFPLVTRSRLNYARGSGARYVENTKKQHSEEVESLTTLVEQHLPRLAQASIRYPDRTTPMFRISVTLSEDLIRQSFTWGNNERELNHLSQIMSRAVFKELLGINSSRYVKEFVKHEHEGDTFHRVPDYYTYPPVRFDQKDTD